MKCPVTYDEIADYIREYYGYTVQTCIIARVLRDIGFEVRDSWNSGTAINPKEPDVRDRKAIKEAIDTLSKVYVP